MDGERSKNWKQEKKKKTEEDKIDQNEMKMRENEAEPEIPQEGKAKQ